MPKAKSKRFSKRQMDTGKGTSKESTKSGEELLNETLAAVAPKESIGEPATAGNETATATNLAVPSTAATNLAVSSTASVSSTIIPSYSLLSQCPLLGNNVSAAVKGKIVASSYVDLAQLLPVNRLDTNQTQRFQLAFNPESPNQLLLQQQPVNKLITNIFE